MVQGPDIAGDDLGGPRTGRSQADAGINNSLEERRVNQPISCLNTNLTYRMNEKSRDTCPPQVEKPSGNV